MQTPKFKNPTDKCVFFYHQANVWWLLPASDYCQACGNQIIEYTSDNKIVLGSSRGLGVATEYLIGGSKKRICRLSLEFYGPHVVERRSNVLLVKL